MNYNKIINAEIWNSLSGIAEYTSSNIWKNKESLLPPKYEYNISIEELKSETYSEMGYLINNYKSGKRSLKTYIFEYLQKRVVSNIFNEYNKIKDNLHHIDAKNKESFEEKHQYGIYEFPDTKNITENIEQQDVLKDAYDKANKIDKLIMEMIYNGYSYEEIAKDLGLNKMDITRRMRKYGK